MDTPLWQKLAETNVLPQSQVNIIKDLLESKDTSPDAIAEIEQAVQTFIDTVIPLKVQQLQALDGITTLLSQYMNDVQRDALAKAEQMQKSKEEEEGKNLFHQL